ncbi:MAG: regulatory protein GemA [Desulfuromonadales bacterium]|nr:regulatory protein GemA [Desulfuromonadales bacterium]
MKSQSRRQLKNPIAAKQIQIVKLAQKELGLDDDTYRELLEEMFGVRSCTELSVDQANELIDELQKKGFHLQTRKAYRPAPPPRTGSLRRPAGAPRGKGNLVALASAEEIDKVMAVAGLIEWRFANGLQRFLDRRLGISGGRVRTAGEAYRAIEGLKKMFENGMKRDFGPEWWTMRHADAAIEEYVDRHAPAEFRSQATGKVYKRS